MAVIRATNLDTFVLDRGEGEPVVFVHGHTLDHRMWEPQATAVVEAGFRAIRYDLRGHGGSEAPPTGYSSEDLAADLKALLQEIGVERAHIVGLSRGGGVTLAFALAYPESTRTITLIDSMLPGRPMTGRLGDSFRALAGEFARGGKPAFLEQWLATDLFTPANRDPALASTLTTIVQGYSAAEMQPEAVTAAREHAATLPHRPSIAERLADITAPALVIVGELDLPDFRAYADEMAAAIPDARGLVVDGAGHMANMEQPEVVNAALIEFLHEH